MAERLYKFGLCLILAVSGILATVSVQAAMPPDESRLAAIDREMDCIDRQRHTNQGITWNKTCSIEEPIVLDTIELGEIIPPDKTPPAPDTAVQTAPVSDAPIPRFGTGSYGPFYDSRSRFQDDLHYGSLLGDYGSQDESLTNLDLGLEFSRYEYKEPGLMRIDGKMYGVNAVMTHRLSENRIVNNAHDLLKSGNKINMVRADLHFSTGEPDYDSFSTGSHDGERHYLLEVRASAGYDIPLSESLRFTPYGGFGYRYLKDDSGGGTSTSGAATYDRQSFYYYIPLGVETMVGLSKGWQLEILCEYDYFLFGTQKSHLEDVSAGYNTPNNDQKDGYGARAIAKFIRKTDSLGFYVGPYVRYWDIEDSDLAEWTSSGSFVSYVYEPNNHTLEYGLEAGIRF